MILEILMVILFILIVLLFLIIIKPLNIHVLFNNNNLDYNGEITINHYLINVEYNFKNKVITLNLIYKSHKLKIKTINLEKSDEETSQENTSKEDITNKLKELYPLLKKAYPDIMELIKLLTKTCKFNTSKINVNLGLNNNNLTIKTCNIIWAMSAPFYPLGLQVLLTPEINKFLIKTDVDISFRIILTNVIRIIIKIFTNKNLRNIIKILRNWFYDW